MNREQLLNVHAAMCIDARRVMEAKNADYADDDRPFGNLELIEALTRGRRTTEEGILIRMGDKLSRLATACVRDLAVADESIRDTLLDLINYAVLFGAKRLPPSALAGNPDLYQKLRQAYDDHVSPAESSRSPLVYIAGPYTGGDPAVNTAKAMDAWHALDELGCIPFCPHLSHFLHIHKAKPYGVWLKHDLVWMHLCDAMLRLPGESSGADEEEAEFAGPIFHSIGDLKAWRAAVYAR